MRQMIELVRGRTGLDHADAVMLISVAGDVCSGPACRSQMEASMPIQMPKQALEAPA